MVNRYDDGICVGVGASRLKMSPPEKEMRRTQLSVRGRLTGRRTVPYRKRGTNFPGKLTANNMLDDAEGPPPPPPPHPPLAGAWKAVFVHFSKSPTEPRYAATPLAISCRPCRHCRSAIHVGDSKSRENARPSSCREMPLRPRPAGNDTVERSLPPGMPDTREVHSPSVRGMRRPPKHRMFASVTRQRAGASCGPRSQPGPRAGAHARGQRSAPRPRPHAGLRTHVLPH